MISYLIGLSLNMHKMILIFSALLLLVILTLVFINQAKFGKHPSGKRLEIIRRAENYRNGEFQNQSITPDLTDGATYFSILKEFLFGPKNNFEPQGMLPSQKTDLINLESSVDVLVWFGHSSYFMQIDGKRILVDPVLSGSASPISFTTKSFHGTDIYTTEDIPEIDYLIITHDHWDHLDYETITKLRPKIRKVITGLGTGAHLEHWGFTEDLILEKNWNESLTLDEGYTLYTLPARHFSGRGFKRKQTLWMSFLLQTPSMKIYIGGDSGYDTHFAQIGNRFGEIDLAILEHGQYNKNWKHIHLMPDEITKAASDLKAKKLLAVHHSKFALSNHAWNEPLRNVSNRIQSTGIKLITPMIGEKVLLKSDNQVFHDWWEMD